jgi:hypothetical protein
MNALWISTRCATSDFTKANIPVIAAARRLSGGCSVNVSSVALVPPASETTLLCHSVVKRPL